MLKKQTITQIAQAQTRLAQANLIIKTDFDDKLSSLNRKFTQNKTEHLLVEDKLNKLKTFYSSYFIGKSHFDGNGAQNYLVFEPIIRFFKILPKTNYIRSWKSKRLSAESIKSHTTSPVTASDYHLIPKLSYSGGKRKFTGSYLKQHQISYTHGEIVNIYIVYELSASGSNKNDSALKNCLFGAVTLLILSKNADIEKDGYSAHGTRFDRRSSFHFQVLNLVKMY